MKGSVVREDDRASLANHTRTATYLQVGMDLVHDANGNSSRDSELVDLLVSGRVSEESLVDFFGDKSTMRVAHRPLHELLNLAKYPARHVVGVEEDSCLGQDISLLQQLHFKNERELVIFGYNGQGFFHSASPAELFAHLSHGKKVALFLKANDPANAEKAARFGDDLAYLIGEHTDPLADVFPHAEYIRVTSAIPELGKVKRYDFREVLKRYGFEGKAGVRKDSDGKHIRIGVRAADGDIKNFGPKLPTRQTYRTKFINHDPDQHSTADKETLFVVPANEPFTIFLQKTGELRSKIHELYTGLINQMITGQTGTYRALTR